ncbi:SPOR domain-containing protein [Novosphingobium aquiterrae]|uniref:SPOR domain-containing protein n=1 Tax=Novosphingobium aquiterrae TaxID=624388 RepID=A0ABV6PFC9_9SPHN
MGRKTFTTLGAMTALVFLAVPAAADTKAGVDAWSRGDFAAAVREWQGEALKGDADALYNLGQAFRLGKGVPQNLTKAEDMYGRAAGLGHVQAADNYGLLLFQRGEQARAMPYVSAAAGRGDPRAQYLLGIAHFNGQLIAKDWVRAYALVSLAQQQGVGPATTALKQMDGFIPLDQRQQAAQLAIELRSQADTTRARQLAAADLGATVSVGVPSPVAVTLPRPVPVASAADVDNDGPATAGADYARPAVSAPRPSAVVATVPPAPRPSAVVAPAPRPAPAVTAAAPKQTGPWRVQLGAFGVAANADALWNRLKGRPELAGHPRINVKAGAVTKLQAGGFASQGAARAACDKLAAAGTSCVAASN